MRPYRPRTKRAKRFPWVRVAVVAVAAVALAGFVLLPPVVRTLGQKRLSALLERKVTIGKVRLNPFLLSAAIEDLDVQEPDGSGSFLGWRRLYVRFDALRSLGGDWVIGAVELDGFHARATANADGSLNFSDLLAKFGGHAAAPSKPGRPVRLGNLRVVEAQVEFNDHSLRHPFHTLVGPLTFTLSGFRTTGAQLAPYHFEAATEAGERLAWSGSLTADPLQSVGQFEIGGVVLKKYTPYFEGEVRSDVIDGILAVSGRYEANLDPKARALRLSGGEVHLRDMRVAERQSGRVAVQLKTMDVTGIEADGVAMKAAVAKVAVAGGQVSVRRAKDGSLNLLTMTAPDPAYAAPAPQVSVGELTADDLAVDVTDETTPQAAHLALSGLKAGAKNLSLADGAVIPFHASFAWLPKGKVSLEGKVSVRPSVVADLTAKVERLDLLPLSPYLEQFVNARVAQGSLSTFATVHAALPGGPPQLTVKGDLSMDKFGLVDAAQNKELVGFNWMALGALDLATAPQVSLAIGQVDVDGPYVRVRVNADQTLNLASLLRSAPAGAARAPAAPAPRIEVGKITVEGGEFGFSDQSVDPAVKVSVSDFGGTLSGISSSHVGRADVDLKGLVGGSGPVAITGKLDPLGAHRFVGLTVTVRNVDLLPLSPYAGRFAGYALARGQLVVDSAIQLDGDKLDATNVVTLNQFTFGAATHSPDATGLPVRLGVALLKDTSGKIVIDLPVQGTLGDPNFRVGKVVLRVIVNLLTKAAVSPFALVGSMFGGGGDELAYDDFDPGRSELVAADQPKLATLEQALAQRPALNLGIEGSYDAAADTYALRRLRLADLVRRRVWEAKHAVDPNIPAPAALVVTPEENAAMVKQLFDAKFPPGTRFGTPLPPAPEVTPPPAPPAPGVLTRIVNWVTLKAQRDAAAARQAAEQRSAEHAKAVAAAVAAGLPEDEMAGRLAEAIEITPSDLRGLATARAERVRNELMTAGHISADRLFLTQAVGPAAANQGPRVLLTLE